MIQRNCVTSWLRRNTNFNLRLIVIGFTFSLLVISLVSDPSAEADQDEVNVTFDIYTITLVEKSYNPVTNLSMWHYRVTSPDVKGPAVKDISHWNLELCHEDPKPCEVETDDSQHNVNAATYPDPWEVNCDPSISDPFWGIKWDVEFDADDGDDVKHFYLYLEGNWRKGEVEAAIKAGPNEYYGTVQGPLCERISEKKMEASLGDLTIVQTNAVGDEVALSNLGQGSCDTCAPFSTDLEVSFTTNCSNYEVKAFYTVEEAQGSSPGGADAAISSEFSHPVLKIDDDYRPLGYGWGNSVPLSGFSNDNCAESSSQDEQCASFPVAVDLKELGDMSSGWKYNFIIHVSLDCL